MILLFIGVMMYLATTSQISALKDGFTAALKPPNHSATVSYSNAMTSAVTKTSSVFLSFLVVFLGGIYVLMPKRLIANGILYDAVRESPGVLLRCPERRAPQNPRKVLTYT